MKAKIGDQVGADGDFREPKHLPPLAVPRQRSRNEMHSDPIREEKLSAQAHLFGTSIMPNSETGMIQ
jgi:hypothetical protein